MSEKYKLVPMEPTQEMVEAARQHHEGEAYLPVSVYKAMLVAAPAVQGELAAYLRKDQLRQVQCMGPMLGEIADSPRVDRVPVYTASQPVDQRPVGYANSDELDNMLDDRTAVISPVRNSFHTKPLYLHPQPAPDMPDLTEALRQYQHNDGSGPVFGYDKLLVDRYVAGLMEALGGVVSEIERVTCLHENTHRGGVLWEICEDCGAKWADDRGGKPEFSWPDSVEKARTLIAATRKQGGEV